MDIEEFIEAKRTLDQNVAISIQAEIDKFERATGRTPSYIDVEMIAIEKEGTPKRRFTVGTVRSEVPLD
ncbi:hypothetical protein [Noviherbaspirillum autotrophicum]|uniref:Uncharacterized protein n=1 Tax=Noviherbaspirillum autotrophicum TaxID=709839 RepID=A0A0C1Y1S8_9BURK|nr:hypothetical protein [Noviherbaspirillum autotrophicum]KIF80993.1 hypothetical protein TSA66_09465 [Noviherbaspirillum autotrophicum]HJW56408.1 hypothetical protein [Burkholderiaceae bacterium]HJW57645.1 hypothetical protein [Burkholderiaceae bacterium]